jgi:hypothetical protein
MISIQKYNDKMLHLWDDFISNSNNGTIFNFRSFLNYHIERSFDDNSLLFFNKKKLIAVLPSVKTGSLGNKTLHSHPGASFGGLILNEKTSFSTVDSILIILNKYCRDNNIKHLVLIQTPLIYYKKRDDSLNYLLLSHNFNIYENYISHYIKIRKEEPLMHLLNKRKKRYLKQLLNDNKFIFCLNSSIEDFYKILLDSKASFGALPTHSLEELNILQKLFPQKIKLLISKDQNQTAGGTLIFNTTESTSLVFYNVVKNRYRNSQLAALQIYKCMELAKKQNCYIVDLGVSHIPDHKNPINHKTSLIQFKEQFGATGVLRTVYKKTFNE